MFSMTTAVRSAPLATLDGSLKGAPPEPRHSSGSLVTQRPDMADGSCSIPDWDDVYYDPKSW